MAAMDHGGTYSGDRGDDHRPRRDAGFPMELGQAGDIGLDPGSDHDEGLVHVHDPSVGQSPRVMAVNDDPPSALAQHVIINDDPPSALAQHVIINDDPLSEPAPHPPGLGVVLTPSKDQWCRTCNTNGGRNRRRKLYGAVVAWYCGTCNGLLSTCEPGLEDLL